MINIVINVGLFFLSFFLCLVFLESFENSLKLSAICMLIPFLVYPICKKIRAIYRGAFGERYLPSSNNSSKSRPFFQSNLFQWLLISGMLFALATKVINNIPNNEIAYSKVCLVTGTHWFKGLDYLSLDDGTNIYGYPVPIKYDNTPLVGKKMEVKFSKGLLGLYSIDIVELLP